MTPLASTAAALRYTRDTAAKNTHTRPEIAAPRVWVDGWADHHLDRPTHSAAQEPHSTAS